VNNYQTIDEIRAAHMASGGHFFSPSTMRFFSSRILSPVFPGGYFVTSERDSTGHAWDGERRYTVRVCRPDGQIDTVSDHGQFSTRSAALTWAREYARGRVSYRNGVIV
jgi:hypothetical protein